MTTTNHATILRALQAARPLIWDGAGLPPFTSARGHNTEMYICDAIVQACRDGDITEKEKFEAKNMIRERLNHRFSLTEWLVDDAGVPCEDITPTRLQAHRIAWVDHLIAEFSAPAP